MRRPKNAASTLQAPPVAEADAKARDRAASDQRRRQERANRDRQREQTAARRRQVAGVLAAAALSWGLAAWLEGAMWGCLFLGLTVDYVGSYADLAATFGAFGYDGWVRWIMPLGIDLPVTASVLAQLLAGRWKCNWWVRVRLGLLTAVTAPLTLAGNALRGAIDSQGHFVSSLHVQLWMDLVAFAVPGAGVVLIGYVASMMQGERAELTRRRLEAETEAMSAAGAAREQTPETTSEDRSEPDQEPKPEPNRHAHVPARAEVRRLLKRHGTALTAEQVVRRTGVSIRHANRLLRQERGLHVVDAPGRPTSTPEEGRA